MESQFWSRDCTSLEFAEMKIAHLRKLNSTTILFSTIIPWCQSHCFVPLFTLPGLDYVPCILMIFNQTQFEHNSFRSVYPLKKIGKEKKTQVGPKMSPKLATFRCSWWPWDARCHEFFVLRSGLLSIDLLITTRNPGVWTSKFRKQNQKFRNRSTKLDPKTAQTSPVGWVDARSGAVPFWHPRVYPGVWLAALVWGFAGPQREEPQKNRRFLQVPGFVWVDFWFSYWVKQPFRDDLANFLVSRKQIQAKRSDPPKI